jgi:hypothetical protein
MRVAADYDLVAISRGIFDPCAVTQKSTPFQLASCSTRQPLGQKMQIYAINCVRTAAQDSDTLCHQSSLCLRELKAVAFHLHFPPPSTGFPRSY